jgi:hypothetical protein
MEIQFLQGAVSMVVMPCLQNSVHQTNDQIAIMTKRRFVIDQIQYEALFGADWLLLLEIKTSIDILWL